jgi:hypothetical protein
MSKLSVGWSVRGAVRGADTVPPIAERAMYQVIDSGKRLEHLDEVSFVGALVLRAFIENEKLEELTLSVDFTFTRSAEGSGFLDQTAFVSSCVGGDASELSSEFFDCGRESSRFVNGNDNLVRADVCIKREVLQRLVDNGKGVGRVSGLDVYEAIFPGRLAGFSAEIEGVSQLIDFARGAA